MFSRNTAKTVFGFTLAFSLIFALSAPVFAGDKEKDDETFANADKVLSAMINDQNIPADLLAKAQCIVVLPGVKKFGIGIGGSGGRGPMTCRTGKDFTGKFSAPAMYSIGGISAGLQVGGSSTDYVLLVMADKGMQAILAGKMKLGNEATAAAGPSGATKTNVGGADIFSYGRAKGLFAGTSLSGASLTIDTDANKRLYGKAVTAEEIVVKNSVPVPASAEPMIKMLDSKFVKSAAKPAAKPAAKTTKKK